MSNTMSRAVMSAAVAIGAMAVVGGFAPGAAAAEEAPSVSPFAGSWSGTWSAVVREDGGAFDWTISDAGRINGTVTHPSVGNSGTLVGHVGAGGSLTFVGMAPSDTPGDASNGFPFQGTAVIDGDGRLVVSAARMDAIGPLVAVLERN